MPNEPLHTKERKELTLTKEGALRLIEIIKDMRYTAIWSYPARVALHNDPDPAEFQKFKSRSDHSGYTFANRTFPEHQIAFTATWAKALKETVEPVNAYDDHLNAEQNADANFITGLLVLLSKIVRGAAPLPKTIWEGD